MTQLSETKKQEILIATKILDIKKPDIKINDVYNIFSEEKISKMDILEVIDRLAEYGFIEGNMHCFKVVKK